MQTLVHQRCFNHSQREAVARCPECRQFYCRECITEHDDRVLCAACLAKLAKVPLLRRPAIIGLIHAAECAVAVMFLWFCFYLIGDGLLRIPSTFHEGSLWKVHWFDSK